MNDNGDSKSFAETRATATATSAGAGNIPVAGAAEAPASARACVKTPRGKTVCGTLTPAPAAKERKWVRAPRVSRARTSLAASTPVGAVPSAATKAGGEPSSGE